MDNTHIGHLSYVGDSIIGENCNLGAGTITANYRLDAKTIKMKIKDKVVDSERTKLGAVLGDNVKAGINTLFMPGVKVGCNSWIGPNKCCCLPRFAVQHNYIAEAKFGTKRIENLS